MWRAARALRQCAASTSPNSTGASRRRAAATRSSPCRIEKDQSVRVYRLRDERLLEELARTHLEAPRHLLWLADRLLVAERNGDAVAELAVSGARIERRRQLIAADERIHVCEWCAVDDGLAIVDLYSKDLLPPSQLCRRGERRARCVSASPRRHRTVLLLLGDVRQRNTRRHVVREGPVGAGVSTARRAAPRGTRAHPKHS